VQVNSSVPRQGKTRGGPTVDAMNDPSGGAEDALLVAERYLLEREVGRGGMGAVWLGQDVVLHRHVALKQIGTMPGSDTADVERVRREARVSAMLNHENVVAVFDLVEGEDHQHWLVMEYLASQNLAERIRRDGPLSPDDAAELLAQAAHALAAAHRAGIVHRDVKPSNMLVTDDDTLKLGDFGIARAKSDVTLTQTGIVTGSPSYLAPEVAAGQPATPASDVWSLGATLFHVVSGQPPYDASENLMGTLYRIVHEDPPRTDKAGWLDPVLRATMHRDPAARWSADDVARFLAHGPTDTARAVPVTAAAPIAATQVLPTVPTTGPEPGGAPPPAPAGAPPGDTVSGGDTRAIDRRAPAGRPRRTTWIVAAAVALVLAVALGGWLLASNDDPSSPPAGSGNPSTKPAAPAQATAAGMEDFIAQYLDTVTRDPETTWKQLTPSFQASSKGYDGYTGFWSTVESATPRNVDANPDDMTVGYTVDYVMKNGDRRTEDVTLELVFKDGRYLINYER
jgi:eukaryotic-like serine/threonine-protein kinase